MRVGEAVKDIPAVMNARNGGVGKYYHIYNAALAANGLWIPVEFETKKKAVCFYNAAKSLSRNNRSDSPLSCLEARSVNLTVYVRVKPTLKAVTA